MQRVTLIAFAAVMSWSSVPLPAQEAELAAHDELRVFREKIVAAVLADDIPTQIELAHPQIVTMWQDGRVAAGHDGLRQFLETLGKGNERGFLGYKQEPMPLTLSTVIDDRYAFAHGTSTAHYDLYGMEFDLDNYWTATLLREDGQWKLLGYHVSGNLADNPLLTAAKNWLYVVGAVAALIGGLLGYLLGRQTSNRRRPTAADANT